MATARGSGSTVSRSSTAANTAAPRTAAPRKSRVTAGFVPYPAAMPEPAEGREALIEQIRREMKEQLARITEILREAKEKKARNDWCLGGYREFMHEAGLPEVVEDRSSYRYSNRTPFTQTPVVLEAVPDEVVQYLNDEGLRFYRKKMWDAWLAQAAQFRATLISYSIRGNITTATVTRVLTKLGLEPPRTVRNVQFSGRTNWNLEEGDAITPHGLETAIKAAFISAGVPEEAARGFGVTIRDNISA